MSEPLRIVLCDQTDISTSPLCCCEYFSANQERSHILECCCKCSEFDKLCENLICCHGITNHQISRVMFMIQDKLRIPWIGGARKMSLGTLLPIILIPLLLFVAAQGVWYSFAVFMCLPLTLGYLHNYLIKFKPHTKFFLSWAITTIVIACYMFMSMAPAFVITPLEILASAILLLSALYCFVRTRCLAKSCHVKSYSVLSSSSNESVVNLSDDSVNSLNTSFNLRESICTACCKQIPARAYHCNICNVCVYKRDLHCMWLDCCIGDKNHRTYVAGLVLLLSCVVLVADLMLITLCSPLVAFYTVQLPEDCSEVYVDLVYAQYFAQALYIVIIALFLLSLVTHEVFMISLGMTGHEWRLSSNRHHFCLRHKSVYSRGFWENWRNFFGNRS